MAHPYKKHADYSHTNKAHSIGKLNNLDIPVMRAVGENKASKRLGLSSASMQHKDQARADGMKKGGRTKTKIVIAAPSGPPPSPAGPAAGAAPPVPAPPMGGPPPMKRGGGVNGNPEALNKMKYPLKAGSQSGVGRNQKAKASGYGFKPLA